MIENLQDELYQLENKQKVINFVLKLEAGGQKMPQNVLESTWERICKIKQYLNYILMMINQNILAILWTFLNLKKNMKLYTK